MNVTVRTVGSVVILDLDGRFTIEADTRSFHVIVGRLKEHVVLNLERVSLLDCSGIGQIVTCFLNVREQGGTLKLLKPSRHSRRLLEMARILTVIEAYESEPDVVESFVGSTAEPTRWRQMPLERAFPLEWAGAMSSRGGVG